MHPPASYFPMALVAATMVTFIYVVYHHQRYIMKQHETSKKEQVDPFEEKKELGKKKKKKNIAATTDSSILEQSLALSYPVEHSNNNSTMHAVFFLGYSLFQLSKTLFVTLKRKHVADTQAKERVYNNILANRNIILEWKGRMLSLLLKRDSSVLPKTKVEHWIATLRQLTESLLNWPLYVSLASVSLDQVLECSRVYRKQVCHVTPQLVRLYGEISDLKQKLAFDQTQTRARVQMSAWQHMRPVLAPMLLPEDLLHLQSVNHVVHQAYDMDHTFCTCLRQSPLTSVLTRVQFYKYCVNSQRDSESKQIMDVRTFDPNTNVDMERRAYKLMSMTESLDLARIAVQFITRNYPQEVYARPSREWMFVWKAVYAALDHRASETFEAMGYLMRLHGMETLYRTRSDMTDGFCQEVALKCEAQKLEFDLAQIQWDVMTFFGTDVDMSTASRSHIVDCFFCEGWSVLYRLAYARVVAQHVPEMDVLDIPAAYRLYDQQQEQQSSSSVSVTQKQVKCWNDLTLDDSPHQEEDERVNFMQDWMDEMKQEEYLALLEKNSASNPRRRRRRTSCHSFI